MAMDDVSGMLGPVSRLFVLMTDYTALLYAQAAPKSRFQLTAHAQTCAQIVHQPPAVPRSAVKAPWRYARTVDVPL